MDCVIYLSKTRYSGLQIAYLKSDYLQRTANKIMPIFTRILLSSLLTAMLAGCASLPSMDSINPFSSSEPDTKTRLCARENGAFYQCHDMPLEREKIPKHPSLFSTDLHFQVLGEYTEQMATDLQHDLKDTVVEGLIVVASFVYLDASLQSTDQLGNQLAEYFINDLQQIGLPVSDHKLTGSLNVNGKGDFVFSRDASQIGNAMDIGYVFSGTMHKNNRGVMVNVRLMNFKTKGVLASASKLIPNILLEGI
ncbi:MAG: TolB-like protein [Paraglaciecola sp.]|jgi:TolB-like protein